VIFDGGVQLFDRGFTPYTPKTTALPAMLPRTILQNPSTSVNET